MSTEDNDLRNLIAAQAADYFVTRSAGRGSEADDLQFLEWLRTSPVHVAEYMAIARVAKDARKAAKALNVSLDELVAQARLEDVVVPLRAAHEPGVSGGARKSWGRRVVALAAAAGLAFVVVGTGWRWSAGAGGSVYTTARGEQRTLQLPDNTVVRLDSDSAISVAFNRKQRVINLTRGQAYFEVAKDPARPFQVRAGEAVIDDIGTVFDVFRKSSDTVVTVVDGIVKIRQQGSDPTTARQDTQAADLHAGDQATISPSGTVETRKLNNLQGAIAWTRNEIVFEGESVASVVSEFNRYNRIQIIVDDPAVAALPITGVFHTFDVRSFTAFLAGLPNVRILEADHSVTVTGAAKRDG